jgi:hypothetical protein
MATPFSDVFKKFLNKITDSQLLSLPNDNLESIMTDYMESAIIRFRNCKQNLQDYDETNQQFNITLTLEEIEILTLWMLYEYHNQNIMRIELLKQSLSSKDYQQYSQANHLNALLSLQMTLKDDANKMMKDYSYYNNDLTGLTNNGN